MAASSEPLYYPCFAAHSPAKLRDFAASRIATLIISYCLPSHLRELHPNWYDIEGEPSACELDKIILCTGKDKVHSQILQANLKNNLKDAQKWWNCTTWFGPSNSYVRRIAQEGMTKAIDKFDCFFQCPLLKFTLQVLFTKEAGIITTFNQIDLELPKNQCDEFHTFLSGFDEFQVQSLKNTSFIFGAPHILAKVLSNAPHLRKIHLRYNSSDYIVQKLTPLKNLEVFICEDFYGTCLVSIDCFYKTFFCGLNRIQILDQHRAGEEIKLTFPKLRYMDIGKGSQIEEFLAILQFFYSDLKSLSCRSENFTATTISKLPKPPFDRDISFTICDIGLTADCIVKLNPKRTLDLLPNLKHVTLHIDRIPENRIEAYKERTKEILSCLHDFSLSLFVYFNSVGDIIIGEIFLPIFQSLGDKITALQFDLKILESLKTYWKLINLCPNLNLFSFKVSEELNCNSSYKDLYLIPNLRSLSVTFVDVSLAESSLAKSILNQLVLASPNIEVLELILPSCFTDWVMTVAAKGLLKNVHTLILKIYPGNFLPDVDFYVPVVEALSQLKHLVLLKVPNIIFQHMQRIFQMSELKLTNGRLRIVAYKGIGFTN